MRYQTRYDAYVGLVAKLQANHKRFACKGLKDIEVINYLNSVYYSNGLVSARCDFFTDGITVLRPVSIGLTNESGNYSKDLDDILKVFDKSAEDLINCSIKINVKEFRFALTAVYPTVAKQFKTYAVAKVEPKTNKLMLKMQPIKQSSKGASSQAEIKLHNANIDGEDIHFFRFNVAMMVDVLKFYEDDDYIVISYSNKSKTDVHTEIVNKNLDYILNNEDEKEMNTNAIVKFNLQSFNIKEDNLIWSFRDISITDMDEYLRKNKS